MSICVIGSINQDYVLRVPLTPRPGETVLAHGMRKHAGGKGANQAVAAARMGGRVRFVGCVGDDDDGARLLRHLRSEGVDTDDVEIVSGSPTGMAIVSVDGDGENSIIVVPGANFAVTEARVARVVRRLPPGGVVVLQVEVPVRIVAAAIAAAAESGVRAVLNLAPYAALPAEVLAPCDPLVLNETEASALLGRPVATVDDALAGAVELTARARSVVVTLGALGAVWAGAAWSGAVPARPVAKVVDTTGAGDAFIGAMCARLAEGDDLEAAVAVGVAAGSFAVTREGAQASYPSWADIAGLLTLE